MVAKFQMNVNLALVVDIMLLANCIVKKKNGEKNC